MLKKMTLLVGVGVGYVLGARAGREQYDKIVEQANALWRNPKVQEQVNQAQATVKEPGPVAAAKVQDAARSASDKATGRDPETNDSGSGI